MMNLLGMRINKYLTDRGYCSRRAADKLIEARRVMIGGRVAVLGDQVAADDVVMVDGKKIDAAGGDDASSRVYIMYNKPFGVTCTTDAEIPKNIIDAVKHPLRVFPIGRLDKASTGLIFLTNDGDIVNKILRARYGHEKEYEVEIDVPFPDLFIKKLSGGVNIGDYVTKPCRVTRRDKKSFTIILTEGKNRQIRRMTAALGYHVKRLHRVRIMNILLGDLAEGAWRDIPPKKLHELKALLHEQEKSL